MNDNLVQLVREILNSDLPKDTRNEIIRFYMLPRNTPVLSVLEKPHLKETIEPIIRPEQSDIDLANNPKLKDELEDTAKMLNTFDDQKILEEKE